MVISRQLIFTKLGFFTLFVSSFIVSIGVMPLTISKYEPLILQRKFGQIRKLKNNVKPTMMPNPRGFFVVNNHKMYADFWTLGRRFQLVVNRGSPAFPDDAPLHKSEMINATSPKKKPMTSRDLDFFSGYLDDNPHLEAYGYISTTRNGDETLVFTVNLGTDSLHIENSEYIVDNDNWFNTIAYLRRDVTIKAPNNPRFRSRRLLGETKPEVVDYYNKVEQYNYSIWEERPLRKEAMTCKLMLLTDHKVYRLLGSTDKNSFGFHRYVSTMAYLAYRRHDFDMDGISDNFAFSLSGERVFEWSYGYKDSDYGELQDVFKKDDPHYDEWLAALPRWNNRFGDFCSIVVFTESDSWAIDYVNNDARACEEDSSGVLNFKRLKTPANVALVFTHSLAQLIGAKPDSDKCTPKNKNVKFGRYLSDSKLKKFEEVNNLRLSPCAMRDINKYLTTRGFWPDHENCVKPLKPEFICGNKVREGDEVCDCGEWFDCLKTDKCCMPVGFVFMATPCTVDNVTVHERREGDKIIEYTFECSPKVHECCDENCMLFRGPTRKLCYPEKECYVDIYCDGKFFCPNITKEEDGTLCHFNTKVCINGSCDIEVCEYNGLKPCICHDKDECHVCCHKMANGSDCKPLIYNGSKIDRRSGTPCGDMGVCENGECDEPLQNVYDFDDDDWYTRYWWMFLIGTIILMFLITLATAYYKAGYKNRKLQKFDDHVKTAQQRLETNALLKSAPPKTVHQASRLLALFPAAPQAVVIQTATRPGTEEAKVLKMLRKGYTMRRVTG